MDSKSGGISHKDRKCVYEKNDVGASVDVVPKKRFKLGINKKDKKRLNLRSSPRKVLSLDMPSLQQCSTISPIETPKSYSSTPFVRHNKTPGLNSDTKLRSSPRELFKETAALSLDMPQQSSTISPLETPKSYSSTPFVRHNKTLTSALNLETPIVNVEGAGLAPMAASESSRQIGLSLSKIDNRSSLTEKAKLSQIPTDHLSGKILSCAATQTELQDSGAQDLQKTVKEVMESYLVTKKEFNESTRLYRESAKKLMACVKHMPNINSVPDEIFKGCIKDALEISEQERMEELFAPNEVLVNKLNKIAREFFSIALTLEVSGIEKQQGSAPIIESLLKHMKSNVQMFDQCLSTFKENTSWLFHSRGVESDNQTIFRTKYRNIIEIQDLNLIRMKRQLNLLTDSLRNYSSPAATSKTTPYVDLEQDSLKQSDLPMENHNVLIRKETSGLVNKSHSFSGENDAASDNECSETTTMPPEGDDAVNKAGTPEPNFPVKDHQLDDDWEEQSNKSDTSDSGTSGCSNSGSYNSRSSGSTVTVHETDKDQDREAAMIEENLRRNEIGNDQIEVVITETEPLLNVIENQDENVGSHFLAPSEYTLTPISQNVCSSCQQHFSTKELLYAHKLKHHATKVCNLCFEIFENVETLSEHVASDHTTHTLCQECFEAVKSSSFDSHASKHAVRGPAPDETLRCRICQRMFNSKENREEHEKSKLHKNAFFNCHYCGDIFMSQFDMNNHLQTHKTLKTNVCKVCCLDFPDISRFGQHLKSRHFLASNKSPKDFICIICGKSLQNRIEFLLHIQNMHQESVLVKRAFVGEDEGLASNKCKHCTSFFKSRKVKAIHEMLCHQMPPFQCFCNEAFYTKSMYDYHVLKHNKMDEKCMKRIRKQKV